MAAAVAAVSGEDWLGRKVNAQRVLYVDEENPKRVPHGRMRALGMTNEFKSKLLADHRPRSLDGLYKLSCRHVGVSIHSFTHKTKDRGKARRSEKRPVVGA